MQDDLDLIDLDPTLSLKANIDALICDLADYRDCVTAVIAYEKLKRLCLSSGEAFQYVQKRVHDVRIPERARGRMEEILTVVRLRRRACELMGIP